MIIDWLQLFVVDNFRKILYLQNVEGPPSKSWCGDSIVIWTLILVKLSPCVVVVKDRVINSLN